MAKRQGFIGRKIGKKWNPGEGVNAVIFDDDTAKARTEGPLAPLKLLVLGATIGNVALDSLSRLKPPGVLGGEARLGAGA